MSVLDLHDAYVRVMNRKILTAAAAHAHLRTHGWDDLWEAFQASDEGNWYSFRRALKGKPGTQKTLERILALPHRKEATQ
jgi:hypothetical protein